MEMTTIIEIQARDNWGHGNNTSGGFRSVPEGWAVFPDGPQAESFPFFRVDRVEEVDGAPTVTAYTPMPMPEPEPEPAPEPTQLDRVEAQTMYTAVMTDTLLEEGAQNV